MFNLVSVDGYFADTNGGLDWHNVDEEFDEFSIEQMANVDALLFGRITYELMKEYWPTDAAATDDSRVAKIMNELPKYVASSSLSDAGWDSSTVIKNHVLQTVRELKSQPGKDIALLGSASLADSLMDEHLIDEFRIMVNPVILGQGIPLFKERYDLRLITTRAFFVG